MPWREKERIDRQGVEAGDREDRQPQEQGQDQLTVDDSLTAEHLAGLEYKAKTNKLSMSRRL